MESGLCSRAGLELHLGELVGQRQEFLPGPPSGEMHGRLSLQQAVNLGRDEIGCFLVVHAIAPFRCCCKRCMARHKTTLTVFSLNSMIWPISLLLNSAANLRLITS